MRRPTIERHIDQDLSTGKPDDASSDFEPDNDQLLSDGEDYYPDDNSTVGNSTIRSFEMELEEMESPWEVVERTHESDHFTIEPSQPEVKEFLQQGVTDTQEEDSINRE